MKIKPLVAFTLGSTLLYSVGATLYYRNTNQRRIHRHATCDALYLTFDDGPHPFYTPKLLDLLAEHNAKATFFVVGEHAKAYPELLKRMSEEGHAIGIHHMHHRSSWTMTPQALREEITQCARVIETITGRAPQLYRPPWGHFNAASMKVSPYPFVLWSHIFGDWKVSQNHLSRLLEEDIPNGSILLLHDHDGTLGADLGAPLQTLEAVEQFLKLQTGRSFCALSKEVLR